MSRLNQAMIALNKRYNVGDGAQAGTQIKDPHQQHLDDNGQRRRMTASAAAGNGTVCPLIL